MQGLIVTIVLMGFVAIMIWIGLLERKRFKENYPPISDEEFVKRCKPGTNPEIAIRVRHIIAEQFGIPAEHIHPETEFRDLE
jgi:hypothetical protein